MGQDPDDPAVSSFHDGGQRLATRASGAQTAPVPRTTPMIRSASIPYRRPIDNLSLGPLRTAVRALGDIACPAGIDISPSPMVR